LLPVKADADAALPVGVDLVGARGGALALGADDDGGLGAHGAGPRVQALAGGVAEQGPPWDHAGQALDGVGVAAGADLSEQGAAGGAGLGMAVGDAVIRR
jgi:hypothetical protein